MKKFVANFNREYGAEKDRAKRMAILAEFVNIYFDSDMTAVNKILERELANCKRDGNLDEEVLIRFMLAYSALERADIAFGQEQIKYVMDHIDQVKDHDVRGQVFNFLAFTHSHQGNFDKAFQYVYECIREGHLSGNQRNAWWGTYTLGVFHYDLKDYVNSEKCFRESAEKFGLSNNKYGVARSNNGLASVFIQQEKFKQAKELLKSSLEYYDEIEVSSGQSRSLNDLGLIFRKTGEPEQALECFKRALQIRKETVHLQGVATSLNEIAELLLHLKKYEEAEQYLHEAKETCEKIQNRSKLYRTHLLYTQLYRNTDRPWQALEHYELYDKLKTAVTGEASNNKIKELQTRMATEKSEKEAEIERLKNVELKDAYDLISTKNKEILDSIRYAKRIQLSLLPSDKYIERTINRLKKE